MFAGLSGPCDIGMNGDRLPYFWFYQFIGENLTEQVVAISEDKNKVNWITEYPKFQLYFSYPSNK